MANKFGPTKSELKFRLGLSGFGLAALVGALLYRGMPTGVSGWETVGIATLFFGGSFLWTLRKLVNKDYPDGL